ncbi:MAG: galactose-1-phosphate uridylyltransferase [bacterium]|nr:galactose-1-phosphate uridylyltransferase [bacterium]
MAEIRKDSFTGRWVLLSPERSERPNYYEGDTAPGPADCPFCPGNEGKTPPEILALRNNAGADESKWSLRVVPNKYPALHEEGFMEHINLDLFESVSGIGAHEVVVETHHHSISMNELHVDRVTDLFRVFKQRITALKKEKHIRYVQVFKNHGRRAGATIPHPHSQLMGLPVIPDAVQIRLERAREYLTSHKECLFCRYLREELEAGKRVVLENVNYAVLAPYASRLPFELSIIPKNHNAFFEDTNDYSLGLLAEIFRETMAAVNKVLDTPDYNLVLNNSPCGYEYSESFHWNLEIIPVLGGTGGFELGTDSYINPVRPEEAVALLKE